MTKIDRSDIYTDITSKIIADLAKGIIPWVRPWDNTAHKPIGLPTNLATGRAYSGINILMLWASTAVAGYTSDAWLTYKQTEALGGQVRKGEKGTIAVYADRFVPDSEKRRAIEVGETPTAIPFLKRFTVFNRDQIDGLPDITTTKLPLATDQIDPVVRGLIDRTRIPFRIGGNQAFYMPCADYVQVPPPEAFYEPVNWHRTALHELSHATGHKSRLDRDMTGGFGSPSYAFEELVAEMSAAFCCASLGFEPTVRHVDYIGFWLDVLRHDKRAIVRAASQASKASDWLLQFADPTCSATDQ